MWEPRCLTTLWASTASYRDSDPFNLLRLSDFFPSKQQIKKGLSVPTVSPGACSLPYFLRKTTRKRILPESLLLKQVGVSLTSEDSRFQSRPGHPLSRLMFMVLLGPSTYIRLYFINYAASASFKILSNSSFTYYPSIRRYRGLVCDTESNTCSFHTQ
jgi:hypothetical protein